jgi:hypothetical protein
MNVLAILGPKIPGNLKHTRQSDAWFQFLTRARCGCSSGDPDLTVPLKVPISRGHFLRFRGTFWPVSPKMTIFAGRFFGFRHFSSFVIRYTRTEDGRLMISSSRMSFKAPQLGPGGCCFVQTVDLALNPTPALTKCDLSPSATVNTTGGTHFQYLPLECERGGTRHTFSLFFHSILGCQVSEFPSAELAQSQETQRNKHFRHARGPRPIS